MLVIQAQITFVPRRLWNISWYIERRLWNRKSRGKICNIADANTDTSLNLYTEILCVCVLLAAFFFYVLISYHVSPYPSLQREPLLVGVPEFWQPLSSFCTSQSLKNVTWSTAGHRESNCSRPRACSSVAEMGVGSPNWPRADCSFQHLKSKCVKCSTIQIRISRMRHDSTFAAQLTQ